MNVVGCWGGAGKNNEIQRENAPEGVKGSIG